MKSLRNLFRLYMSLADRTLLFDNSQEQPALVVNADREEIRVANETTYSTIQRQLQETDYEEI